MSKYVKNLITEDLRTRLTGVEDALLVNLVGLDANTNNRLRKELEQKHIEVMVVKNSLAARAVAGTALAPMFNQVAGTSAICWGAQDVVALAKEVTRLAKLKEYAPFEARGGVMGGEQLSSAQVQEVSKWPTREEQLSRLVGQILGPGARLAAQLLGPGGALASQVASRAEEEDAAQATEDAAQATEAAGSENPA